MSSVLKLAPIPQGQLQAACWCNFWRAEWILQEHRRRKQSLFLSWLLSAPLLSLFPCVGFQGAALQPSSALAVGILGWKRLSLHCPYTKTWTSQISHFNTSASHTNPLKPCQEHGEFCAQTSECQFQQPVLGHTGVAGCERSQWVLESGISWAKLPLPGWQHLLVLFCSWNAQNDLSCALCWTCEKPESRGFMVTAMDGGSRAARSVRRRIKFYESSWYHWNLYIFKCCVWVGRQN